jgi:ribosomal protein S18 acetylase RimI-like enzyme
MSTTSCVQPPIDDIVIRRELQPGDAERIVDLHDRIYKAEYGLDHRSRTVVERDVGGAVEAGWPERLGAVWLVEREDELIGSLALTVDRDRVGVVHWFVLDAQLRGYGLGRLLIGELLAEARAAGLERLELVTFSKLTAAAHIYRKAGFRVVFEQRDDRWGPLLTFQRYELGLS